MVGWNTNQSTSTSTLALQTQPPLLSISPDSNTFSQEKSPEKKKAVEETDQGRTEYQSSHPPDPIYTQHRRLDPGVAGNAVVLASLKEDLTLGHDEHPFGEGAPHVFCAVG